MSYLLLSILSSSILVLLFKAFERYKVHTFKAIVINYIVAAVCGYIVLAGEVEFAALPGKPWFEISLLVGFLFIIMFWFIALTAQKVGVSVSAVAQKMAVVVPVTVALIAYEDESLNFLKGSGILLALFGVYLSSRKTEGPKVEGRYALLPLVVFIGAGFLDTTMNYVERFKLDAGDKNTETLLYTSTLFFVAFLCGAIAWGVQALRGKGGELRIKDLIGGIALGIPNFGAIYFLLRTLSTEFLQDSAIFPINNMGIVAASTLGGVLIFGERLSTLNRIGVLLSLTAIAMIAFASEA